MGRGNTDAHLLPFLPFPPAGHYRSLVALQSLPGSGNGSMPRSASTASVGSTGAPKDEDELVLISPKPRTANPNPQVTTPSSLVVVKKDGDAEGDGEKPPPVSPGRIWGLSRPESKWVALAVVMAVVNGCTFPAVRTHVLELTCWMSVSRW